MLLEDKTQPIKSMVYRWNLGTSSDICMCLSIALFVYYACFAVSISSFDCGRSQRLVTDETTASCFVKV
jgi:hypothetical protein